MCTKFSNLFNPSLPLLSVEQDADSILIVVSDRSLVSVDTESLDASKLLNNDFGAFKRWQHGLMLFDSIK